MSRWIFSFFADNHIIYFQTSITIKSKRYLLQTMLLLLNYWMIWLHTYKQCFYFLTSKWSDVYLLWVITNIIHYNNWPFWNRFYHFLKIFYKHIWIHNLILIFSFFSCQAAFIQKDFAKDLKYVQQLLIVVLYLKDFSIQTIVLLRKLGVRFKYDLIIFWILHVLHLPMF